MTDPSIAEQKEALRQKMGRVRADAAKAGSMRVLDRLGTLLRERAADAVLTGYLAIGSEVDVTPVLRAWIERGGTVGLPCTGPPGSTLVFRTWRPGDALVAEPYGTRAPPPTAVPVEPDIVLVPLLAFDRGGNRLGWGGGFYDRTLRELRGNGAITAVGVAFAAQEVEQVPAGPGDEPLDLVVTENEVIRIGGTSARR